MIAFIIFLLTLILWKVFFKKYKITLISPLFRNTETKELGGWLKRSMHIPFPPFPNLTIHDGKGHLHRIRDVQYDRGDKTIICQTYFDQHICENDKEQYEHTIKCARDVGWKFDEVSAGHILKTWKEEYEN